LHSEDSKLHILLQTFSDFAFCDDVIWQSLFIEFTFAFLLLLLGATSIPNLQYQSWMMLLFFL